MLAAAILLPGAARADEAPGEVRVEPRLELVVERFRYDNDLWVGRDDAFYSGGFGAELYSPPLDDWELRADGEPRRWLPLWIGNRVPGLRATRGRALRYGSGFIHTSQTPDDIRSVELQPNDVPYAATLGAFWSWTAFDNRSLDALQVYAGLIGPGAAGREVHHLIHSGLARGPTSGGWRWQLDNEPLLNANYALKRKIAGPRGGDYRGLQGDLAFGFHQALGNYYTATDLQLEFRAGSHLGAGFAQVTDPIGRGIGMEPVLAGGDPSRRWFRVHASLVVRATGLWHTPLLDGNTFTDSPHPGVDYEPFYFSAIAGVHLEYGRLSVHVSYSGSGLTPSLGPETRTTPSWLSITFDVRRPPGNPWTRLRPAG